MNTATKEEIEREHFRDPLQEKVSHYLTLRAEVNDLEEKLKEKKSLCAEAEEALSIAMVFRGVRAQKLLDGSSIYLAPELHVSKRSGVSSEELCAALKAAGLGDFVQETYGIQSIKAWCKEHWETSRGSVSVTSPPDEKEWDAALPAVLQGMLKFYQRTRVRVRNEPTPEELDRDADEVLRDGPLAERHDS